VSKNFNASQPNEGVCGEHGTYTVQRGDTLKQIAAATHTDVWAIIARNRAVLTPKGEKSPRPDLIRPGMVLDIITCEKPPANLPEVIGWNWRHAGSGVLEPDQDNVSRTLKWWEWVNPCLPFLAAINN
jgi:hypothetical protein